jgi:hypothetical protein
MSYLDIVKRLEQTQPSQESEAVACEKSGLPLAVKIGGSAIGDFWLCLAESESFEPGDGLPVYRPSEIRALIGKGYGSEDLRAIHGAKVSLNGNIWVEAHDDSKCG